MHFEGKLMTAGPPLPTPSPVPAGWLLAARRAKPRRLLRWRFTRARSVAGAATGEQRRSFFAWLRLGTNSNADRLRELCPSRGALFTKARRAAALAALKEDDRLLPRSEPVRVRSCWFVPLSKMALFAGKEQAPPGVDCVSACLPLSKFRRSSGGAIFFGIFPLSGSSRNRGPVGAANNGNAAACELRGCSCSPVSRRERRAQIILRSLSWTEGHVDAEQPTSRLC